MKQSMFRVLNFQEYKAKQGDFNKFLLVDLVVYEYVRLENDQEVGNAGVSVEMTVAD